MTDTSTLPEPALDPELPEEDKGKSRMWLYFIIGAALLLLIAFIGTRQTAPSTDDEQPALVTPEAGA